MVRSKINDQIQEENKIVKLMQDQKEGQERIEKTLEEQKGKQEQMIILVETQQEEQKEISKAMDDNFKTVEDRLTAMESYDCSDYQYVEQTGQGNQTNEITGDKDGTNVKRLPCKCGRLIKIIHTMKTKESNGNSREETWEHNYNAKCWQISI